MTHFAPRQGIFAVILFISLFAHILLLVFSGEKAQQDARYAKGNQIVNQLNQEATLALASQDKVSLSVITNRYQTDNDVAKLAISDAENNVLVQTGQAQSETGQVIDKAISQDNKLLGHLTVTMKDVSKGEIISSQWPFVLGSAILHGFLLLFYSYLARPTKEQLLAIGEKVQQRLALSRGGLPKSVVVPKSMPSSDSNSSSLVTEVNEKNKKDITHFLHNKMAGTSGTEVAINASNSSTELNNTDTYDSHYETISGMEDETYASGSVIGLVSLKEPEMAVLQIRFFDEYNLFDKVAPEIALPYLALCDDLLHQCCQMILSNNPYDIERQINRTAVTKVAKFDKEGTVVEIKGEKSQITMVSVLLGKLFIILNQVVYEKHRELGRFALPTRVGVSLDSQYPDMQRLLTNHSQPDSILMLFPSEMLKTLDSQIQLRNKRNPTTLIERQMVWYDGMAEVLIKTLIEKRNTILLTSLK